MDNRIRQAIVQGRSEAEIRTLSRQIYEGSLLQEGVKKLLIGQTSAQEVLRATLNEDLSI